MTTTCAIVVCDHGLGHIRRCLLMALEKQRAGHKVTLFAPYTSVKRLQRTLPSTHRVTIYDFETRTSISKFRRGLPAATEWIHRLPSLDEYDIVICDNFPEILEIRTDAIISAQFFWHDVIEDVSQIYFEHCANLLECHNPRIIGCELFSMDSVRRQRRFTPVGLYKIPGLNLAAKAIDPEQKTNLLVTGGTTKVLRNKLHQVIRKLIQLGPHPFDQVYVDPELLPNSPPAWMTKADFSFEMYCSLKASVCRPGLGVLTDLLTVGARIYPIYEAENKEMINNAFVISKLQYPNPNDFMVHKKIAEILGSPL